MRCLQEVKKLESSDITSGFHMAARELIVFDTVTGWSCGSWAIIEPLFVTNNDVWRKVEAGFLSIPCMILAFDIFVRRNHVVWVLILAAEVDLDEMP